LPRAGQVCCWLVQELHRMIVSGRVSCAWSDEGSRSRHQCETFVYLSGVPGVIRGCGQLYQMKVRFKRCDEGHDNRGGSFSSGKIVVLHMSPLPIVAAIYPSWCGAQRIAACLLVDTSIRFARTNHCLARPRCFFSKLAKPRWMRGRRKF